jgi:hypothetical protein
MGEAMTPQALAELRVAGAMAGFAIRRLVDRVAVMEDFGIIPWRLFDVVTGVQAGDPIDHTPLLQLLADKIRSFGGGEITARGQTGSINFGSSLILPMGVSLTFPANNKRPVTGSAGLGTLVRHWTECLRLIPLPDAELLTAAGGVVSVAVDGHCRAGYLIFGNVDPRIDPAGYLNAGGIPGPGVGHLEGLRADGTPTNGVSIFRGAGPYRARNWAGDMIAGAYHLIPGLYTDKKTVELFDFYIRADNTTPLVDCRGTGDALSIRQIECGYWNSAAPGNPTAYVSSQGVWVSNCRGGEVFGLVNGNNVFTGCGQALTVKNCHIENGSIQVVGGSPAIRDNFFINGKGLPTPIQITNPGSGNGYSGRPILDGNIYYWPVNAGGEGGQGWGAVEKLDVLFGTGSGRMDVLDMGNNARIVGVSGQLDVSNIIAPRMGTLVGAVETPFPDLVNYPFLQRKPMRLNKGKVPVSGILPMNGTWDGFTLDSIAAPSAVGSYKGANGTRTYRVVLMFDTVRNIGRGATTGGEAKTIAVVNGGALPKLTLAWGAMDNEGLVNVRVYASDDGTANYTHVADIPALCLNTLYDDGEAISSIPWRARGGGDIDTVQAGLTGTLVFENGQVTVKTSAQAAPSSGTWKQGDKTVILAPTKDANNMWREGATCFVAGTPGTWENRYYSTVSPAV